MTNSTDDAQSRRAAELLEAVVAGQLEAATAIAQWPDPEQGGVVGEALHLLHHFAADGDIRARDESYAAAQRSRLMEAARRLKP